MVLTPRGSRFLTFLNNVKTVLVGLIESRYRNWLMSLKGNKLKRKTFGNVFVNIWIICLCRGIRNVPHVSITGNHPTEGHATVLPAVRDVRIPVLCCLYKVRFPGRHWETCSHQGKDYVTMEKRVCDCVYKYSDHSWNFDEAEKKIHVTIDTVCFRYTYDNMDTLSCFKYLLQLKKLSNAINILL